MRIRLATPDDRAAIDGLFAVSESHFEREAISEHKRLRALSTEVLDVVAVEAASVVGYGQAAWHGGGREPHWAIEAVAAPSSGAAVWAGLVEAVAASVPATRRRYLWVTRDAELPVAEASGWSVDRSLHEMHRPLPVDEEVRLPDGVEIRGFRRGVDEQAWLDTHNASFAGHPEVGGMTSDELELRLEQAWFDPAGLLLAWRDGAVVGSCWTKRHGEDVGEIYLIGLHPTAQGEGLGRQMVLTGLDDLYGRQNARDAMLYVDGANAAALALYAKLGFSAKSVIYRLRPSA